MDFNLPELGEGVYEAEMSRWLVKEGDEVKPGQGLLEVLTDKATMEVPAPFAGIIGSFKVHEGQKLKIGDPLLIYQETTTTPAPASSPLVAATNMVTAAKAMPEKEAPPSIKAAPSVRVMARKLGVDLAKVKGSGPGGRILVDDLANGLSGTERTAPRVADIYGKPGTRIKYHGVRRMIAEHMVESTHTIPHYTYVDEMDATALVHIRNDLRASRQGPKITYLTFFVKAVAQALKDVPLVNASLDEVAGEIVLHDAYHIGIAVATPGGLLVPVVHHADRLSLLELAAEMERLSADARAGQAKREDLLGGTFTITSIGNLGGLFATPIIHLPQVGILGIGKIVKRPVFDAHGQIRAADMVFLSYSFDHRVLDGAIGTAFGNAVMHQLKNPISLLLK